MWRKRRVGVLIGDSADQGCEEPDGLGRLLGLKRDEVGLCQLDLLIHVIPGRLSLTSPAFGPDLRLNLVDIVVRRTPRFLHAERFTAGPVMQRVPCGGSRGVPAESAWSSRGVPA
jgi:hypothetical protein